MISRISMKASNINVSKLTCAFTLIELLLVLVIIAIAMATITPRLGDSMSGWQVRENTKNMLSTIKLARQLALTRQEIIVFVLDNKNKSYTVRSLSKPESSEGTSNGNLVPKQFLGEDVKIVQLEGFKQLGNEKNLIFWPDGRTETAHIISTTKKNNKATEWHIYVENDGSAVLQEVSKNE
jgi:prepilin-type N-terminal cleavage/methylation domain-containing protein